MFFSISVSYSISCVYSSGSWKHTATLIALPLWQAFPIPCNQSFSRLLCNCWFVDWGLTFSSKGRLLRSGILCRITVYESVIFPTSCCLSGEWVGHTQWWAEKTHTGEQTITVQIFEKEQSWTPCQMLWRIKWTILTTVIHFSKSAFQQVWSRKLQRSLREKLFL